MSEVWVPRSDQELVLEFGRARDKWALFAPTGAGKTAVAATWADEIMNDRFACPRLLIVAPPIVAAQGWPQQLQRWKHLAALASDVRVLSGSDFDLVPGVVVIPDDPGVEPYETMWHKLDRQQKVKGGGVTLKRLGLQFRDAKASKAHLLSLRERVHIVSWTYWSWLAKAYGSSFPYQGVIWDESSFLKDTSSTRNRAARHVVARVKRPPEFLLELTGTPNSNHGPDVFPQIHLIAPGLLGKDLTEFRDRWCRPDVVNRQTKQVYSWRIVPALQDQFNALVATVAVSVPSSLAVPLVSVEHRRPLPEASRAVYDAMAGKKMSALGVSANGRASQQAKLRQIASGFLYTGKQADPEANEKVLFLDDTKMEELAERVETVDGPVLVAYSFIEELRRLRKLFGKGLMDIREAGAKEAFEAGKLKLLSVHPQSAGHGVDGLQHASNQVMWTTVPQDRELYDQLNGRIHRHGTRHQTVYVHHQISSDTVEEEIYDEVLPGKLSVLELLMRGTRVTIRRD